jgi:hypothetical protein
MKVLATLGMALCVAGVQCYATTLNGRLMDAACYNEKKVASQETGHKTYKSPITKTCAATPSTTAFAVRVRSGPYHQWEGETIKLDDTGNSIAAAEMRAGTLHPDRDGDVHVRVSGHLFPSELLQTRSVGPTKQIVASAK